MVFFFVRKIVDYGTEMRNSERNIYKIASNSVHKKERPNYLCRSNKSVSWLRSRDSERNPGVLDDTSKPKFTRLETVKPF